MWTITTDEPLQPAPYRNRDEHGWVWEIERDGETRRIAVTITGPAKDSAREDIQAANQSQGRSAVERVLDRDDPPGWITLTQARVEEQPHGGN